MNLVVYFFVLVLFSSFITLTLIETISAQIGGITDFANPLPTNFPYSIPANTIIPIQAAWDSHKNADLSIDLVTDKPNAVIVYVPSLAPGSFITFEEIDSASGAQLSAGTLPLSNNHMATYFLGLSTPKDITVEINDVAGITPATISAKTT